ncbi:MAG: class I SAM-dependent methyltransferase [Planctomycetaceae bacterium]|nr:class I SAM-dependent methyltransferase [Planctomycetaceae bacterium]
MDVQSHNKTAWDANVDRKNPWTIPVTREEIERARLGKFELRLTPLKPVPMNWFPPLQGTKTLCLASAGGQQGPILAAAGALVTVFDNSPGQLRQDQLVAERDSLEIKLEEGDMADLSRFSDDEFDLIVHPCSNCFVPRIRPVWNECFRLLRSGGILISGFLNPIRFLFDYQKLMNGNLEVRHRIPYSDLTDLNETELHRLILDQQQPLAFGHTLTDQIAGQLDAGFILNGFFEDRYPETKDDPISKYVDSFIATRVVKP